MDFFCTKFYFFNNQKKIVLFSFKSTLLPVAASSKSGCGDCAAVKIRLVPGTVSGSTHTKLATTVVWAGNQY